MVKMKREAPEEQEMRDADAREAAGLIGVEEPVDVAPFAGPYLCVRCNRVGDLMGDMHCVRCDGSTWNGPGERVVAA